MLKALKWAYDLGVRQERVRISAQLQLEGTRSRVHQDSILDMLRNDEKVSIKKRDRLDFEVAVSARIQDIISTLFEPQGDWIKGSSIMFPDDNHKGEIK